MTPWFKDSDMSVGCHTLTLQPLRGSPMSSQHLQLQSLALRLHLHLSLEKESVSFVAVS